MTNPRAQTVLADKIAGAKDFTGFEWKSFTATRESVEISDSEKDIIVAALRAPSAPAAAQLQARKVGQGEWTDIYPSQVEAMSKAGHNLRAIEMDATPEEASTAAGEAVDREIVAALERSQNVLRRYMRHEPDATVRIDMSLFHSLLGRPPVSDMDYDDHLDGEECWNCGGEGRVNHCIDGCCVDQDDIYCEYCSRRCDVCHPPTPEQVKSGNELRQVLADALANPASSGERQDG